MVPLLPSVLPYLYPAEEAVGCSLLFLYRWASGGIAPISIPLGERWDAISPIYIPLGKRWDPALASLQLAHTRMLRGGLARTVTQHSGPLPRTPSPPQRPQAARVALAASAAAAAVAFLVLSLSTAPAPATAAPDPTTTPRERPAQATPPHETHPPNTAGKPNNSANNHPQKHEHQDDHQAAPKQAQPAQVTLVAQSGRAVVSPVNRPSVAHVFPFRAVRDVVGEPPRNLGPQAATGENGLNPATPEPTAASANERNILRLFFRKQLRAKIVQDLLRDSLRKQIGHIFLTSYFINAEQPLPQEVLNEKVPDVQMSNLPYPHSKAGSSPGG